MSENEDERARRASTTTTTTTTIVEEMATEPGLGALTAQEERVVRMIHGLSEPDAHRLRFALGASPETKLRLAMLERYLLELFEADELDESIVEAIGAIKRSLT